MKALKFDTTAKRTEAIENLDNFWTERFTAAFNLPKGAKVRTNENMVLIELLNEEGNKVFGSDVRLYREMRLRSDKGEKPKKVLIDTTSVGSFNPENPDAAAAIFGIKVRAALIENWDASFVLDAMQSYKDLETAIWAELEK